jgi:hypothetical protein
VVILHPAKNLNLKDIILSVSKESPVFIIMRSFALRPKNEKGKLIKIFVALSAKTNLDFNTMDEKLAVFIKFKNEILRPYGLRMTENNLMMSFCSRRRISCFC